MLNINFKKNFSKIALSIFSFLLPIFTFAVDPPANCEPGKVCNPISTSTLDAFLRTILVGVIKIGIPVIVLAIVYSGFLFVSASGNSEKLKKAKDAFMYTIIGAAILLGAWALAQVISETVLAL
ncbi:MAG: pilin [Candidatus Nomurabacteria bacterium]|nr:pilin [Candidatus Nomurabacteria bacterium]